MEQKFLIRELYKRFKRDCGGDTEAILAFLNWLHYEKNEVVYLKDMEGLKILEESYIDQLLEGKIPNQKKEDKI